LRRRRSSIVFKLSEKHGWTYGAYSNIGGEKFRSSTSVRNAVTDSSVVEILSELKKIRTELVSADDLKNAKAKYIGNFVMQIQNQLRYALNTEIYKTLLISTKTILKI
jgi:predicted Zn-dependent peptidase